MGDRLDDDLDFLLRKAPESLTKVEARRLANHLKKLAGWVLAPEVLAKARAALRNFSGDQLRQWQPPLPLPQGSGACWVVAVRKSTEWCALRKAFVLPLRWEKNTQKSAPPLPEGLKKVADCVVKTLRIWDALKAEDDWQLVPALDGLFDAPGLELLEGTYDSAWVPLASALLVAAGDGKPDKHIWATGAWKDGEGVRLVEGIEEKIELAVEHGARVIFLPEGNHRQAEDYCLQKGFNLEIKPLPAGKQDPREALREYLLRLPIRATQDDPLEEREKSYLRIHELDKEEALEYYREYILDDLAEILRSHLPREIGETCYLITTVSDRCELVLLSHAVFRPRRSIILYQDRKPYFEYAEKVGKWLEGYGFSFKLRTLPTKKNDGEPAPSFWWDLLKTYRQCMGDLQRSDTGSLILDVTPGTKPMSILMAMAAPDSSWLLYYDQKFDPRLRKPLPCQVLPIVELVEKLRASAD